MADQLHGLSVDCSCGHIHVLVLHVHALVTTLLQGSISELRVVVGFEAVPCSIHRTPGEPLQHVSCGWGPEGFVPNCTRQVRLELACSDHLRQSSPRSAHN